MFLEVSNHINSTGLELTSDESAKSLLASNAHRTFKKEDVRGSEGDSRT